VTKEANQILRVSKLTIRYGDLVAVSELELDLGEGEILGLIGPNGSGKSTTFKGILGIVRPFQGTVFLNGENLVGLRTCDVAKRGIAYASQVPSLFPEMSVYDNVCVGFHSRRRAKLPGILLRTRGVRREDREVAQEVQEVLGFTGIREFQQAPGPFSRNPGSCSWMNPRPGCRPEKKRRSWSSLRISTARGFRLFWSSTT
jgi:branched-chain amino acid transport system ATP-binding protein